MIMRKKDAIAEIRRMLLAVPEKRFTFDKGTAMRCWLYEEPTPTDIISIRVHNNCVLITTADDVRKKAEEEKFSEFDIDEVKQLIDILARQIKERY